jgi:methionyl-tRNA formyltransferase
VTGKNVDENDCVVFFGTPAICLPFLEALEKEYHLPLIITQPDTMAGRNRKKLSIPPVKTFALEHRIRFLQPETLKDDTLVEKISQLRPVIGVVISYGSLIPGRIFKIPVYGTINVHFSLLPSYRGAAPVQRALENGETKTGITIFEIVKKMDAGDIWTQKEMDILPEDTTETLWERMSREGAPFLRDSLKKILSGKIDKKPQDHKKATYAPMVQKKEGIIDWHLSAQQIFNRYRAFTPWPGIFFCTRGKSFKLTKVSVPALSHDQQPGDVLSWDKESLKVGCGDRTVLEILELQPPGKKAMTPYCYCMGNDLPHCLVPHEPGDLQDTSGLAYDQY